jgi:hypothetical protein
MVIIFNQSAQAVEATLVFEADTSDIMMGPMKCIEEMKLGGKSNATNKDVNALLSMLLGGFCGANPKKGEKHTCSESDSGGTGHFEFIFKENGNIECSYNPKK